MLTPESIATYATFLLGVILSAIGFLIVRWISRARPQKIYFVKSSESSLIEIDPQVRDEIDIKYKGKPANSLYLTKFSVQNSGREIVDTAEMLIDFHNTEIIDVVIDDPIPDRLCSSELSNANSQIHLKIPYLNPEKLYRDIINVKVFALRPISVKRVRGGGRGWTVEFLDQAQLTSDISDELINILSTSALSPTRMIVLAMQSSIKLLPKFLKVIGKI